MAFFLFTPMPHLLVVILLALHCCAGAAAAADRPHLSSDPRVESARTLVKSGRFHQALTVLRPLVPDHPDQTDVRFLIGLAAIGASRQAGTGEDEKIALLDEAIAALHSILVRRPGLVRVRLELALAFFLKEDDALARQHFQRVLAGRPTRAMVANINRFLKVMRDRQRWSGYFGVAIAPDTNVNSASDAEFIYIHGFPFRRGEASRATSDTGVAVWGGAEYRHPLGDRLRLRSTVDVAHREYSRSAFEQTFVAGRVGPQWSASRKTELSLLASARQSWLAGARASNDYGAIVEVRHRFIPRLTGHGQASWHRRDQKGSTSRDGPLTAFSLGVNYVLLPTVQLRTTAGYSRQKTETLFWRNDAFWTELGINQAMPWGFTLGGTIQMRWTDFKGRWWPFTPDGASRRDRTRVLRASVLNRGLTVYGFSPQVIFVNEQRDSNAQLYDLQRNRVELRIVRQF